MAKEWCAYTGHAAITATAAVAARAASEDAEARNRRIVFIGALSAISLLRFVAIITLPVDSATTAARSDAQAAARGKRAWLRRAPVQPIDNVSRGPGAGAAPQARNGARPTGRAGTSP